MPIYDYRCEKCRVEFEKLVLGSGAVICPACQSQDVTRLPSRFGISIGKRLPISFLSGCGSCRASSCTGCASAR